MSEELRFHMEQYAEDLVRGGVPPAEAHRRARLAFGTLQGVKEDCREARGLSYFDEAGRELRYAMRLLRKSPGFTATALLTLALCIGANLTIFAVVDSVLLRPLPFPHPNELITIFNTYPKAGVLRDGSSITNYYERRGKLPAIQSLSIYRFGAAIVGEPGSTELEQVTRVSPEFFSTLGAGLAMGRAFRDAETTFQTDQVAILTDAYWRRHFHAANNVIGRSIRVDGLRKTVVGVLPAEFRFLSSESQLYFPLASRLEDRLPSQRHSGGNTIQTVARLQPEATVAQAQAQIDAQNAALGEDKAMTAAGFRSLVVSLHGDHVAAIRPILLLLQAGVLALLLIGSVNLVNLLLIRASGRVKELAVRQALGASRRSIIRETVVETTLLTISGGTLGLAAAAAGVRLIPAMVADRLPLGAQIAMDSRVAAVALVLAVLLGLALAIPIAWLNLRRHLGEALQWETRSGTVGRTAQTLRHCFIAGQIALGFILLAAAGQLALSLNRVMAVSPGFQPAQVLTGQISLPWGSYPKTSDRLAVIGRILEEIDHQPGSLVSGVIDKLPFSGRDGKSAAKVKGYVPPPGEAPRGRYSYGVGGDYFRAMGFSLREGRFLTDADSRRAERVCVVDEDFARFYWPNGGALGQKLFQGPEDRSEIEAFTIAGVVGGVKQAGLTDPSGQGAIYYPYAFRSEDKVFLAVRTGLAPERIASVLQQAVRHIDPNLPVNDVRSMDARIAASLVAYRSPALLAIFFSSLALMLTAIGTYGVLSYAVSQRRREIGLRMALGARPDQIRGQFIALTVRLLGAGIAAGLVGAWVTRKAMQPVLFQAPPLPLAIFAGTAVIVAVVALAACLLPAGRAARISPMQTLAGQ